VLLLGQARPSPATIEGLTVVVEAKTLGITFKAFTGDPIPDWEFQLTRIKSSYSSISRWTLTAFGRAYASSTYAVSRVLHHAEYSGAPPAHPLQELEKITAKLVARGQAPDDPKKKFVGVHHKLLLGSPSEGGFGAFPWAQHIKARHALIALRAITGDIANPWVFIAQQHLRDAGFSPLSAIWNTHRTPSLVGGHLGYCLQILQTLPQPTAVSQPVPGPWCADVPLWGRIPHLSPSPSTYLEAAVSTPDLPLSGLETLGDVITALDKINASNYTNTNLSDYIPSVYMQFFEQHTPLMRRTLVSLILPESARTHLEHLIQQLPTDWVQAARHTLMERAAAGQPYAPASILAAAMAIAATARAATIHRAAPAIQIASACNTAHHLFNLAANRECKIRESCQVLLKSVGWPRWRGHPLRLCNLTVKMATRMILRQETAADYSLSETQRLAWVTQQQQQLSVQNEDSQDPVPGPSATTAAHHSRMQPTRRYKFIDYVADATGSNECKLSEIMATAAYKEIRDLFRQLGPIKWTNKYKEPFWKLVYNGLPLSARISQGKPCGACRAAQPGRLHHFWECPIAQTLVISIDTCFSQQLTREHLWLGRQPQGVFVRVWHIVCLAAISAMDSTRRYAYTLAYPKQRSRQQRLTPEQLTEQLNDFITRLFWETLAEFAAVCPSPTWASSLAPDHPFLHSIDTITILPSAPRSAPGT
jgi:hypothetical protein